MEPLTDKQQRVLNYIEREVERCNYPPSVREIGRALGISSTATVHGYLDILEKKGYIERMPTKPRAIMLMNKNEADEEKKCLFAPLIGRITAGLPILAEENLEGYFPVPGAITAGDNCFVLRVSGNSMVGAGIDHGDYVIVRQQQSAENGEIVAVKIGEEATIKRFYRDQNGYRLQPENEEYAPIITTQAEVLGKVVGLFRRL